MILRRLSLERGETRWPRGTAATISALVAFVVRVASPPWMPKGTVDFWRDEKGLGRIVGDDGEEFFVLFSGIDGWQESHMTLTPGERVEFSISEYVAADDDPDFPDDDIVRRCLENVRGI